jgi:hypothetical protein
MSNKKPPKNKQILMKSTNSTNTKLPPTIQDTQNQYNDTIIKNSGNENIMMSLIKHATGSVNKRHTPRLAFVEKPLQQDHYAGVYKLKKNLVPDNVIKQIRVQNLLVAGILRARGNTMSMMGHVRKDRFDVGVEVNIKPEFKDYIEPEQMIKIQERMDRFTKLLINCGHTDGLKEKEKMTLPEFLDIQTRNGLGFGRFATEMIYKDPNDTTTFHRFRPADAGTFYPTVKKGELAESVRQGSIKLLETITGQKIDSDVLNQGEYDWVQVIDGFPRQAFTSDELLMYNLYPSSDIEHNGYPVTPIDTVLTSITTHMSIEVYNKLYFQNGRANKGMLVIQSDEIDDSIMEDIKQLYNASINDVTNSFRTPIFGVSKDDKVEWIPTTGQKKDGEFQFLFDQVTRNILSAFNMSPDELPGYGHLSRGTNQQGLSESNNEYKLIAARDTGIRPLILKIQDFFNEKLFPILDEELSQLCMISFAGFDADTKKDESTRLQQDLPIHYTYDVLMEEVEKEPVGEHLGGSLPFNEFYNTVLDKFFDVNKIKGEFVNSPAAFVDPLLKYRRDQFWFQNIETLKEFNPRAVQAYFATRKDNIDILKQLLQEFLDEDAEK